MFDSAIRDHILKRLDQLPVELQQRVLEFADALIASSPRGVPGRDLLACAGVLSKDDAREISEAIESGCEQVNPNDW